MGNIPDALIYQHDYSRNQALCEAVRQSELLLKQQQVVSNAADQRAFAFCALIFLVVVLTLEQLSQTGGHLIDVISLGHLLFGAGLAAISAAPSRFFPYGGTAEGFQEYFSEPNSGYTLWAIAERNDENIKWNDAVIARNSRLFKLGLFFSGTGLLMLYADLALRLWRLK